MLKYALAAPVVALGLAMAPAANATVYHIGDPNFFVTSGTPFTPSISAIFFNFYAPCTTFDDTFEFTIPQNGTGSGSISTSFSSNANKLTITDLIINGVSYSLDSSSSGQSALIGGIIIESGVLNTIQVKGFSTGAANFTGTATFSAAAIPEPAVWALMVAGFTVVGAAMRRRQTRVSFS